MLGWHRPHTLAEIPWENFFPQVDSNQRASRSTEPRHDALNPVATVRDNTVNSLAWITVERERFTIKSQLISFFVACCNFLVRLCDPERNFGGKQKPCPSSYRESLVFSHSEINDSVNRLMSMSWATASCWSGAYSIVGTYCYLFSFHKIGVEYTL